MPSLKEVRNRIVSVNSTMQITKAMKMVAAAKLRRAQDRITQMRPYATKLNELIATVAAGTEVGSQSPYTQIRPVEKVLIIGITSDRGLCGGFNNNIVKAINALVREEYTGKEVTLKTIGKKVHDAFKKKEFALNTNHSTIFQNLSFETVKEAAEEVMDAYASGFYDEVVLVFNEFKNVATQVVQIERMLPMVAEIEEGTTSKDYIFEPSEEEIILDLLPKAIKMQLYKAVLESNASEHGARMTAMDKATENGGELLKDLKVVYNRSRQAAITKEILEIVGGAEALKES